MLLLHCSSVMPLSCSLELVALVYFLLEFCVMKHCKINGNALLQVQGTPVNQLYYQAQNCFSRFYLRNMGRDLRTGASVIGKPVWYFSSLFTHTYKVYKPFIDCSVRNNVSSKVSLFESCGKKILGRRASSQ